MKIIVYEDASGAELRAEDESVIDRFGYPFVLGTMLLNVHRTRHSTPYLRVTLARAPVGSGIGTKLYEAALRYACDERKMPLRSDTLRSVFSENFWRKQVAKGRATCTGGRAPVHRASERSHPTSRQPPVKWGKRGGVSPEIVNTRGEYWPCAYYEAACAAHRLDGGRMSLGKITKTKSKTKTKSRRSRCARSTAVYSLLVPKTRSRTSANAWMKRHSFKASCKPAGPRSKFWHCPQRQRGRVVGTKRFGRSGILARIGC